MTHGWDNVGENVHDNISSFIYSESTVRLSSDHLVLSFICIFVIDKVSGLFVILLYVSSTIDVILSLTLSPLTIVSTKPLLLLGNSYFSLQSDNLRSRFINNHKFTYSFKNSSFRSQTYLPFWQLVSYLRIIYSHRYFRLVLPMVHRSIFFYYFDLLYRGFFLKTQTNSHKTLSTNEQKNMSQNSWDLHLWKNS